MNINSPCLNCPNRTIVCHSTCELYRKYKEEHTILKEKLNKLQQQENDYYSVKEDKYRRIKRR